MHLLHVKFSLAEPYDKSTRGHVACGRLRNPKAVGLVAHLRLSAGHFKEAQQSIQSATLIGARFYPTSLERVLDWVLVQPIH